MGYYTTGYRKINGERRKVRLLHEGGKIRAVRMAGGYRSTDRTAARRGLYRTPGYVNTPQRDARVESHRHTPRTLAARHIENLRRHPRQLEQMPKMHPMVHELHERHQRAGQMLLRNYR